ncbi:alpha/beta hydrolase [Streptomyces sp. YIM S03343]
MLPTTSKRLAARRCACASAAVLAVLAAGPPATTGTSTVGRDTGKLSRFYDQKIKWSVCDGPLMPLGLECGRLTVPVDYAHPAAGTLTLALARYRATGRRSGSVVLNFGGPGVPGVGELASAGGEFTDLTKGHDVVSFDPRGVGRSSPVGCGGAGTLPQLSGTPSSGGNPRSALRELQKAAAECAEHSGPVLAHIGTLDTAQDLDVLRAALGDRKLNYLGFSYGTRLGAVYAARFPHQVGRLALDGVDTLVEPLSEQGVVGAEGQQRALDGFLNWCMTDIACPLGRNRREAGSRVVRLVRSLDEDPVPTPLGQQFTGQDMVVAVGQALYSRQLWPALERALSHLLNQGDPSGLESLATGGVGTPPPPERGSTPGPVPATALATALATGPATGLATGLADPGTAAPGRSEPESVPFDNLPAALTAIDCADDPDRPSAGRIIHDLARLRAVYEHASPVFGRYRLTQVLMCYGRPKGTEFIRTRVKDLDTPRMLLVGTRGDPATPYRWTVETARRLGRSAVVLDNRGEGHTGYSSSQCVHRKVDDFLRNGSLPPSGSICLPEEG